MGKPHIWSKEMQAVDDKIYKLDVLIDELQAPSRAALNKAIDSIHSPNHPSKGVKHKKPERAFYNKIGDITRYRT